MKCRYLPALLGGMLSLVATIPALAQSTINIGQPATQANLTSLVVRQLALAAASDINGLISKHPATSLGQCVAGPMVGEECLTVGATPYTWNVWTGAGGWGQLATINPSTGVISVSLNAGNVTTNFPLTSSFSGGVATLGLGLDSNFSINGSNQLALTPIASGNLIANCGGSLAEPTLSTWSSCMDRNIGSSNGMFAARLAGVWGSATFGTGLAFSANVLNLNPASVGAIGGVNSIGPVASQWINSISTAGLPSLSQPVIADISGWGTGVATALGNAINAAGGLATSASPTFSGTFAGTYTIAGTPTLSGSFAGTPSFSGANFVTLANIVQDPTAWSLLGNATGGTANYAPFTIGGLTAKTTPVGADQIMIADSAASGALKVSTLTQAIGALSSGVSSFGGSTGNVTVTGPLQVVGNPNGVLSINATTTAHGLPIWQGTAAMTNTGTGTLGQALVSNGAAADPSYKSGTHVLLNTLTASASANLQDTTSITASYNDYEIVFENIITSTANSALILLVHSGGSFQTATYVNSTGATANGVYSGTAADVTSVQIGATSQNNILPGLSGTIRVHIPSSSATTKHWNGIVSYNNTSSGITAVTVSGIWNGGNGAIDGFEVCFATSSPTCTGTMTSGVVKIYGIL